MTRAALVSLIYTGSLRVMGEGLDDAKMVTLMSTDVERAVNGLQMLHETWARILEIAIGIYLLTTRMGAVSISPILVAAGK